MYVSYNFLNQFDRENKLTIDLMIMMVLMLMLVEHVYYYYLNSIDDLSTMINYDFEMLVIYDAQHDDGDDDDVSLMIVVVVVVAAAAAAVVVVVAAAAVVVVVVADGYGVVVVDVLELDNCNELLALVVEVVERNYNERLSAYSLMIEIESRTS